MNIAFIGLGNMGLPMARNLLLAGHELTVYNRTRAKAGTLKDLGAKVDETPGSAASQAEAVVTMLSDDPAVEEAVFGEEGFLGRAAPGALHVSMSTVSVGLAKRLAEAHARRGQEFVSAPVFGRPDAADKRLLYVVAAGSERALARCRPLFEAVGQRTFVAGSEPFLANVVKLAGNFLLASAIEAMGEASAFSRKQGLEPSRFLEIMTESLLSAPSYKGYAGHISSGRYEPAGFRLALGYKDVRLLLEDAADAAVPMPFASVLRDHYLSALAQGLADADWSAVAAVSAREAGLEPAGARR